MSQGGGLFAVESFDRCISAGSGAHQQPLGGHDGAVQPVNLSAASHAADDPNFVSDDFRMNVRDEVLDQPERIGHFRHSHSHPPVPNTHRLRIGAGLRHNYKSNVAAEHSTFGCGCGKATTRPSSSRWRSLERPIGRRCCLNHHGSIRRGSATTSRRRSSRSAERTRPQLQSIGVSS